MSEHTPITKTPSIFPNPLECTDDILCISRDLNTDMLIDAYNHGIFPWPFDKHYIPWCSPDPRGIIRMDNVHISHNVKRLLKKKQFRFEVDSAFEEVIRSCADMKRTGEDGEQEDTWITPKIIKAYCRFHELGYAHSFEAYEIETGRLAGGLYGISLGRVFCGESMFHTVTGASKFTLFKLLELLRLFDVQIIDTQMVTPVTEMFGAVMISKHEYLELLGRYWGPPLDFSHAAQNG